LSISQNLGHMLWI
jgi:hypothetical protein